MGNILLNLIKDCESKTPQCWEMAEKIRELELDWDAIYPIFKFSGAVRKVIYTTNAIESLNPTSTIS